MKRTLITSSGSPAPAPWHAKISGIPHVRTGLAAVALFAGLGLWQTKVSHQPLLAPPASMSSGVTRNAVQVGYEVVGAYPHDRKAFLQGLLWDNGGFYEGTGIEGQSTLRRVEFPSGRVLQKVALPNQDFGEGVALAGDRLFQLTWKGQKGYIYDRKTLRQLGTFSYPTEGWGLTFDGRNLIRSDGTDLLSFINPQNLQEARTLRVTMNGKPLRSLNELEWINGEIWANVWQTDIIVRIDPYSGVVRSFLNLGNLLPAHQRTGGEDVLNGIAYDPGKKRLFVSGKLWPRIFEIRLKEK